MAIRMMALRGILLCAMHALLTEAVHDVALAACIAIGTTVSSASAVYYPGSANYTADLHHWVPSSSEAATCSVQVGSTEDVSRVMRILSKSSVPFAIKGGGHSSDVGMSSTTGVHIAMSRLDTLTYKPASQTVHFGAGLTWDAIYTQLEPLGVNVAGGRVSGVGIGYVLGGGYSWLSNKHGLSCDNVVSLEVVLPSGKIVTASATSYPDLFAGLKGGLNNFGVVTSLTMRTYPQGKIWGGPITYNNNDTSRVLNAISSFSTNNADPDGNIFGAYIVAPDGTANMIVTTFYNAPNPPKGYFARFLDEIPIESHDVKTRPFTEFISSTSGPYLNPLGYRGEINSMSTAELAPETLTKLVAEANYYSVNGPGSFGSLTLTTVAIEPFIPYSTVNTNLSSSAYPHNQPLSPLNFFFGWPDKSMDHDGRHAIRAAADAVRRSILMIEDVELPLYPNYAVADTPVEKMYGPNLGWLRELARKYDPQHVMRRAGGFKF